MVKNPPAMWETWVRSLAWEDPLEKEKVTRSSVLAWRIPWTIQSMGSLRVGHNWVTFTFTGWFWCSKVWEPWLTSLSPYNDHGRYRSAGHHCSHFTEKKPMSQKYQVTCPKWVATPGLEYRVFSSPVPTSLNMCFLTGGKPAGERVWDANGYSYGNRWEVLGWSQSSFGFFPTIWQKNLNEIFGQPNSFSQGSGKKWTSIEHQLRASHCTQTSHLIPLSQKTRPGRYSEIRSGRISHFPRLSQLSKLQSGTWILLSLPLRILTASLRHTYTFSRCRCPHGRKSRKPGLSA